ncbi:MAG: tetratricopeptide repeat protein [Verrucomicrobiaceae bacterium]|nr:MAG: tetratricopeptide repeat protein [Verrucomicrobiaceae bacterium]
MRSGQPTRNLPAAALLAVLLSALPAGAQDKGLGGIMERATAAMDADRWQEGLDLANRAVRLYGDDNPQKVYGAQFGAVYYRKGLCEMKLKRWNDAVRSFETCYRDFPNKGNDTGNVYQKMALLKQGEAAMGAEKPDMAVASFTKFLTERDRARDVFPQGSFYINLAICHYKLGHLAEGNENLEVAIRNKENFPTPDTGIIAGFQELVSTAVGGRDEQGLLDFIGKNRGGLVIAPAEMRRYAPVFLKLAGDALAAGMTRAALAVYQFIPGDDSGAGSPGIVRLAALALIHERAGNVRGAFAAYQQLVHYHPDAAGRGEYLYHLVRTASLIGEEDLARQEARRLYADFPDSPHLAEIRATGFVVAEGDPPPPAQPSLPPADADDPPLPADRGFAVAVDLYQDRKYHEALAAFGKLGAAPVEGDEGGLLARFYETECLRRLGNLEGLAKAVVSLEEKPSLGARRLRQLEIDGLWELVGMKQWEGLGRAAQGLAGQRLPGDQRAQVAFCQGLALENLGHRFDALNAYNVAMTADAGASEEVARSAAIGVLRIHHGDPDVRDAIARRGTPEENAGNAGAIRLKEAAAVASLFELSLGAGASLPQEFREFLDRK